MYALVVLPSGNLVAGGDDGDLYVVDLDARAVVATLQRHSNRVTALAVLPGGGLASASYDGTVLLWDVTTWEATCIGDIGTSWHTYRVTALVVLPDGRLASGSDDGVVRLWDVGRRACVSTLVGWGCVPVCALAVLSDHRLAGVSEAGRVCVWETHDAAARESERQPVVKLEDVPMESHRGYTSLALLPDGRLATSGGGGLQLWQLPARASRQRRAAVKACCVQQMD